ncbi:DUF3800 domain-containing protein [Roseateles sp. PN1]|uniref:DUF3800 domain-containing protein n=1 Tax=Roseateles sp. PN1 TaxID=3137372 RepID=UPI00313A1E0E
MLEAYIDDSASDSRQDKRLVLAGYMQDAQAWERFSKDWRAELANPPTLTSLHMTTSFRGWSEEAREAKIDALVAVLGKYRPLSIECAISRAAHAKELRSRAPYDLRHPYFACFVGIMYGAARAVIEEGLSGPVDLTFDEQGNVGTGAALWYLPVKHNDPSLTRVLGGPPRFASDDEVAPLQAADMLAWYVRRAVDSNCSTRQREVADAIRFRHRYMEIPDHLVAKWGKAFEQVPGVNETKGKRGSVVKFMTKLVAAVPPDRMVSVLEKLHRRSNWLRRTRRFLIAIGWSGVWKRIARLKFKLRWPQ